MENPQGSNNPNILSTNKKEDSRSKTSLKILLIITFALIFFQVASRLGTPSVNAWRGLLGGLIAGIVSLPVLFLLSQLKKTSYLIISLIAGGIMLLFLTLASGVYPEFEGFGLILPFLIILVVFFFVSKSVNKRNVNAFVIILVSIILVVLLVSSFIFINTNAKGWHNTYSLASVVCEESRYGINDEQNIDLQKVKDICENMQKADGWSSMMKDECLSAVERGDRGEIDSLVGSCRPSGWSYGEIDTFTESALSLWYNIFID
jgi:hypothetical protein